MGGTSELWSRLPIFGLVILALILATTGLPIDDANKQVWFSNYGFSFYSSSGIYPTGKSDINIVLTAEPGQTSRQNLAGTGLWKMTIFASKEDDPQTTQPLFKQDQVLSQELSDMPIQDGAEIVFVVDAQFELGQMGGCDGDYKYFCVLFTKGDNPDPDFDFDLETEYSKCSDLGFACNTDGGEPGPSDNDKPVGFSNYGLKLGSTGIYPTGKSDVIIVLTAVPGQTSRQNLAGTGLWKMTIFASKEDDPQTTQPLFKQDQVLSQELSDMPIQNGANLLFDVDAQFELGQMGGCDGDYKYFCVLLTKGDNPDPDFDLATEYSKCSDLGFACKPDQNEPGPTDDQKPVSFSRYSLSLGLPANPPTGKSNMRIKLKAVPGQTSRQNLAGTGLWKMTIFASKEDDPQTTQPLFKQDQVLSQELSNMSIQDGANLLFDVDAQFELGQMGGCDGDYKYFCVLFTKGDNPDPDFVLATEYGSCANLGFAC